MIYSSAVADNSVKQTEKDMPTTCKNLSVFLVNQFSESRFEPNSGRNERGPDIGGFLINAHGKISLLVRFHQNNNLDLESKKYQNEEKKK